MKGQRLTVLILLIFASISLFGAAFELDTGAGYEFTFNIGSSYSSCASYGVEVDAVYSFLHAEFSLMYTASTYSPLKARASLGLAFDFWGMRTVLSAGNEYSLIRNAGSTSLLCGGIPETPFWDAPLTLSFGVHKLFKNIAVGLSAHFATPLILSKNNLPDVFLVMKDRNLLLYYLKSSSLSLSVRWRFR